jgi:hypothetical protein
MDTMINSFFVKNFKKVNYNPIWFSLNSCLLITRETNLYEAVLKSEEFTCNNCALLRPYLTSTSVLVLVQETTFINLTTRLWCGYCQITVERFVFSLGQNNAARVFNILSVLVRDIYVQTNFYISPRKCATNLIHISTLSNPIFLPTAYSPVLILGG